MRPSRRLLVTAGVVALAFVACSRSGFAQNLTCAAGPAELAIGIATQPGEELACAAIVGQPGAGVDAQVADDTPGVKEEGSPVSAASSDEPDGPDGASTPSTGLAGVSSKPSLPQGAEVPGTYAELKELYLKALQRIVELETALQDALDLARGYRSDWEEERALAEARKAEAEQALEAAKTLQDLVNEMKDIVNKQHDIIMKLTEVKPASVGFTAGVSIQRAVIAPDRVSYAPGFTVGIIVFP